MMFILPSVYSSLDFLSINLTSIYKNSESKVIKNMKFLKEIIDQNIYY